MHTPSMPYGRQAGWRTKYTWVNFIFLTEIEILFFTVFNEGTALTINILLYLISVITQVHCDAEDKWKISYLIYHI